ncbi:PEP-CTERM/exosortase system-associated acyltransferase [Oryzisolibacter sp. LB2S]|uniref:PEP-CTERM/exosortase system-associated acyltransferase n=1 Tax=Alicycliphilus soli TaxID=3228789 RepID=UPI003459E223
MSAVLQPQQGFSVHFTGQAVSPQQDKALFRSIEQLRYQVYCEECEFLPASDYPEQRETDEYDANSAHFAALNQTDQLVGYVRLVFPDALQAFPFQTHCVSVLDNIILPPAAQSAEISRLMVHNTYRRRQGEKPPAGMLSPDYQPRPEPPEVQEKRNPSPQILLTLYREMYHYSVKNNIRYWYAAMERSLARILTRMNFGFQQIGPFTDYYGPVAPYVADLRVLEYQLSQRDPALYAWMRQPLADT